MTVGKWNYDTHEYEPYDDRLPAGSRIVMNWDELRTKCEPPIHRC